MADFASSIFLHHPSPTIILCEHHRLVAINNAASTIFDINQAGLIGCQSASACTSLSIKDLDIEFREGGQSWESFLHKSGNSSLPAVGGHKEGPETAQVNFRRRYPGGISPPISRHDSPVEDSFPLHQPKSTATTTRSPETLQAEVGVQSWKSEGCIFYIIAFSNLRPVESLTTTQRHEVLKEQEQEREHIWFEKAKAAIFDDTPRWSFISDPSGTSTYLNVHASAMANGERKKPMEWYNELGVLWDVDFKIRTRIEDYPLNMMRRTKQSFPPTLIGLYDPTSDARMICRAWGNPLYDALTGEYLGSVLWVQHIGTHEEVKAQEQMGKLRSFETICDTMPHYVWTADENGGGEWFSRQWLEYTGLTMEECMGLNWKRNIHPEDAERFLIAFEEAHNKATTYEIEARCRRADGVYRWMLKKGAPIKDSHGSVLRWVSPASQLTMRIVLTFQGRHQHRHTRECDRKEASSP